MSNVDINVDGRTDGQKIGRLYRTLLQAGAIKRYPDKDHEIISMAILSLPLFQKGQLSVSGKRMCTILVNR